jgi:hypothetical protein
MSMFISNEYFPQWDANCDRRDVESRQREETPLKAKRPRPATGKQQPLVSVHISGPALEPVRIRIRRA